MMAEIDGVDILPSLATTAMRFTWVHIILLTTLSAKENVIDGLDSSADDYLIQALRPACSIER